MTTTTSATSSTTAATTTTTSAASTGQQILTSLNAGSGLDTDTIITGLTAAEKTSLEGGITAKQTANAAQISSLGSISSDISTFSTSLNTLISGGTLFTQPSSSDTSTLTVSAIAGSRLGGLSAQVEVKAIAKSQTIESQPVTDPTNVGSGTLTVTVGTSSVPIAVGGSSTVTTLAQLATAITGSGQGLTASVVTDSTGQHLVVKGATGAAQAVALSSSDADMAPFTFDPTVVTTPTTGNASGMGLNQAAQDATVVVDGVTYTRATNSFTDVIPGVKMNLLSAKVGSTVTIGSTRPTDAITQAVNDFVSAYNTLRTELATATAATTSTADAGPLRGNAVVRDIQRQLAQMTTTKLTANGSITTLAQIGVKTARDGTLSVDATALSTALTNYPDDVEALFNPQQTSSTDRVGIASAVGAVPAGTYTITGITKGSGTTPSTGSINGVAGVGSGATLSGAAGSTMAGLLLTIYAGAPTSATLTIDMGIGGALQAISNALTGTSGTITTLTTNLTTQSGTLADQLTAADAKLTVYHDRLVAQFTAMNTRVSAFKATQSYMTQQIDLWTKSTS
ncbi:MAG: flagellar hook-associated 2 protein [Sphingomonas bacterium]|nr:flagellar hook-associated 2 protein [Sphingomonas bacterium]